ncbi:MYXO-CTERM sorting domain-containing protein [Sorangium sp. So ce367]|uniref:MYXO-CTERM sorting domain-containing protein n=1 Tax=Sorangium sp. So ce367 TaxID=3133305 RepID=UPI003F614544
MPLARTLDDAPLRPSARRTAAAPLLVALAFAACAGHDPAGTEAGRAPSEGAPGASSAPAAAPAPAPHAPPSFDLGQVIERIHFAFRPDTERAATWTGGHATYAVRADADGFRVAPVARDADAPRMGAAAVFSTVAIGRALAAGPGTRAPHGEPRAAREPGEPARATRVARVADDGHLVVARAGAAEHLRNGPAGVEQSFEFSAAPAGDGDLVVRVRVDGLRHAGATEGGHHFIDPASGLGLRYGVATWIDARGTATRVPVAWDAAGELALRVPEALVETSAYPAVLDPIVSPELAMDEPIAGPSLGAQSDAAVASDGTNFLVVWSDWRGDLTTSSDGADLYAARIAPDGTVLDPRGIPISTGPGAQEQPAISWDGTNYLVAWSDHQTGTNSQVYATRVSPLGSVLNPGGMLLNPGYRGGGSPSIAFDGARHLVVWIGVPPDSATSSLVGTFVTPEGVATIAPAFTGISGSSPVVASARGSFVVAWSRYNSGTLDYEVRMSRVSAAGGILDPAGILVGTGTCPRLATDGSQYALAWVSKWGSVGLTRLDAEATRLDTTFVDSETLADFTCAAVAFDGSNYLVGWPTDSQQMTIQRFPTAGPPLPGTIVAGQASQHTSPAIASGGGRSLVVWRRPSPFGRPQPRELTLSRIAADGALLAPSDVPLTPGSNRQLAPDAAFDGANYLVVWDDTGADGDRDIHGTRVSPAGEILDPSGIAIADAPGEQAAPRVAFDGENHLVVWQDDRNAAASLTDIYAARVTPRGEVLAASPLSAASAAQTSPDVAAGGGAALVAWTDGRNGGTSIYATRVEGGRSMDGSGFGVTARGGSKPAVGFGGGQFLVAWRSGGVIVASRVGVDGLVLDPTVMQLSDSAASAPDDTSPGLAFDGVNHLVVWLHPNSYRVQGRTVPTSGRPGESFQIHYAQSQQFRSVTATFDGVTPVIAWEQVTGPQSVIVAARLLSGGALAPPGVFAIESAYGPARGPSLATNGAGQSLVAYAHFDPAAGVGSYRARGRIISLSERGAACSSAHDCVTGFCVDGVCCDSACGGDVRGDCQVCSVAAGAAVDGECTPLTAVACDDGAICTTNDTCQAGVCVPGTPVTCAPPDSCHQPGTCNTASGRCRYAEAPNGTACDDGDACTQTDTCQRGACVPGSPVTCAPPDACHEAGTCDPATGACSNPERPDGAPCPGGTCVDGLCNDSVGGSGGGTTSGASAASGGASAGSGGVTAGSGGGAGAGGATAGSGGGAGAGGATAGSGGDAPGAGDPDDSDGGGCGCRTTPAAPAAHGAPLALLALAFLTRRQRRC